MSLSWRVTGDEPILYDFKAKSHRVDSLALSAKIEHRFIAMEQPSLVSSLTLK